MASRESRSVVHRPREESMVGSLLERLYWRWVLVTEPQVSIRGLRFVYLSAEHNRSQDALARVLEEAMERISVAKGGFGELVGSHLRFIAAINAPRSWIATSARGYISTFPDMEVDNPHYLACRIVWAATFVRLSHDHPGKMGTNHRDAINRAAYEAQVRFVDQFPDSDKWTAYLARHPTGI